MFLAAQFISEPVVLVVLVVAPAEVAQGLFSAALEAEESVRAVVRVAVPVRTGAHPLEAAAVCVAVGEEVHRFVASQVISSHGGFGAAQDESVWPVPSVGGSRFTAGDLQRFPAHFPYLVSPVEVSPDRTAAVGRQLGSHVAGVAVVQADVDPRDHDPLRRKVGAAASAALVRCFFAIIASAGEE